MSKDKRHYSLLIVPPNTSQIRRFSVPGNLVKVLTGVTIVMTLFVTFGAVRLAQHESLNLKYMAAKSEN